MTFSSSALYEALNHDSAEPHCPLTAALFILCDALLRNVPEVGEKNMCFIQSDSSSSDRQHESSPDRDTDRPENVLLSKFLPLDFKLVLDHSFL